MSESLDAAASQFTSTIYHDTYDFISTVRGDFTGRRVLVTGASKGIGQSTAVAFARAGYSHIALLARSSVSCTVNKAKEAAQASGYREPQLLALEADLTSAASIDAAALTVRSAFGSLDILINNAGYLETWKPMIDSEPDDWWRTWEVNVKGTYLVKRAFMPLLLKSQEKTMITVTSAGAWFTTPGASAYQGSKTAQVRMNNHLTTEYGNQGLLAYSIHPGGVKTTLSSAMPENYKNILLQDEPELAADTIVWLTKERLEWLADRYICVCWDMEELLTRKDDIFARDLLKLGLRRE